MRSKKVTSLTGPAREGGECLPLVPDRRKGKKSGREGGGWLLAQEGKKRSVALRIEEDKQKKKGGNLPSPSPTRGEDFTGKGRSCSSLRGPGTGKKREAKLQKGRGQAPFLIVGGRGKKEGRSISPSFLRKEDRGGHSFTRKKKSLYREEKKRGRGKGRGGSPAFRNRRERRRKKKKKEAHPLNHDRCQGQGEGRREKLHFT